MCIVSLEVVELPLTLIEVGEGAFASCKRLRKVVLNEGLLEIQIQTFHQCTALERIETPSTVTEVSFQAFAHCTQLKVQHVVLKFLGQLEMSCWGTHDGYIRQIPTTNDCGDSDEDSVWIMPFGGIL